MFVCMYVCMYVCIVCLCVYAAAFQASRTLFYPAANSRRRIVSLNTPGCLISDNAAGKQLEMHLVLRMRPVVGVVHSGGKCDVGQMSAGHLREPNGWHHVHVDEQDVISESFANLRPKKGNMASLYIVIYE